MEKKTVNRCAALMLLAAYGVAAKVDDPENFDAKFQTTYIRQQKPSLNSPYAGPHSLLGEAEKSYSFTATAAFGVRLGPATEAYFGRRRFGDEPARQQVRPRGA